MPRSSEKSLGREKSVFCFVSMNMSVYFTISRYVAKMTKINIFNMLQERGGRNL